MIPWDWLRSAYRDIRKALFTKPRPPGPYFFTEDVENIERSLGKMSFAPNWEFSYNKRGEDLNLAQVVFCEQSIDGETYRWWQTHVRGWLEEGGISLRAHWELEPTEHDKAHVDEIGFDLSKGMMNLRTSLDKQGISYRKVRYDGEKLT